MKKARIAELKARLSEYLRTVRSGHDVVVYDRETPIARLVPYHVRSQLVVRKPLHQYKSLGEIPMPPGSPMDADIVDLLLEDRSKDVARDDAPISKPSRPPGSGRKSR